MKFNIGGPALAAVLLAALATAAAQDAAYKYEIGKPYKYLLEFNNDMIQEVSGQTINVAIEGNAAIALTHDVKTDEGNMHINLLFDNALIIAETPQGMQTFGESLKGKSVGYTIDPTGKGVDQDSLTFTPEAQDMQIVQELFSMFPIIDPTKLSAGGAWDHSRVDTLGEGDNTIIRNRKATLTVKENKKIKDRDCLAIEIKRSTETSGKMNRGGMVLRMTGEEKGDGIVHYDPAAGIIVEMTLNEAGEQTIQDTGGTSLKIFVTTRGKTSLEYLPD